MNFNSVKNKLSGLTLELFINRIKRPHNVYSKLAVTALLLCGGAVVTPFWQQALEGVFTAQGTKLPDGPLPSLISGGIFLLLTFLFAVLSQRASERVKKEALVDSKVIAGPIAIGKSKIYCYCGSILDISEVEVLVTSENRFLTLGGIDGTSVSGRVRRLAASFKIDGSISSDPLEEHVKNWKAEQQHNGPYPLGTCAISPPFNATSVGVKHIIHAVALEKRDTGINYIDEQSIRKIISLAIDKCTASACNSVFIPIFGLGSGGIPADEAIAKTINPLLNAISANDAKLNFYIGTYRATDAVLAKSLLLRKG